MAGRKPKPTAQKKLEGNPGKRKLNTKEPVPGKGMPDCPKWLLPVANTVDMSQLDMATLEELLPWSPTVKQKCRNGRH